MSCGLRETCGQGDGCSREARKKGKGFSAYQFHSVFLR
jgi:hypothetical protein